MSAAKGPMPTRRMSAIGALVVLDREAAKVQILRAMHRSRGRLCSAAIELGTRRRRLEGIVRELDLWPDVDACRDRWRARRRNPLQLTKDNQNVSR